MLSFTLLVWYAYQCFAMSAGPIESGWALAGEFLFANLATGLRNVAGLMARRPTTHTDAYVVALTAYWFLRISGKLAVLLFVLLRRGARERLASAVVFYRHILRAVGLGLSALLTSATFLHLYIGPGRFRSSDTVLAAGAALFPGIDAPSSLQLPPTLVVFLGMFGWVLLGLWLAPVGELFFDWRQHYEQLFAAWMPCVRRAALALAEDRAIYKTRLEFRRWHRRATRRTRRRPVPGTNPPEHT
jgi:hypothetical protein